MKPLLNALALDGKGTGYDVKTCCNYKHSYPNMKS